jgi:hypothetical protein
MGLDDTWGFRIGGGLIGVLITVVWWWMRLMYTQKLEQWEQSNLPQGTHQENQRLNQTDQEAGVSSIVLNQPGQVPVIPQKTDARMHPSGLRISLADSRYF